MEPNEENPNSNQSCPSTVIEMRPPPELVEAMQKLVSPPRQEITQDDVVWLHIYCAVASCFNSERTNAVTWADAGLIEFKKRFRKETYGTERGHLKD
jgi:hypothetical protein